MDPVNDITFPPVGLAAAGNVSMPAKPESLEIACRQFEGLLMGMVLKNSMGESVGGIGEQSPSGMDGFRDFCIEQVAATLSEESPLGVADQLLAQTKVY